MHKSEDHPLSLSGVACNVASSVKEKIDLDGRVARNPYGSVAAAIGIGYVLGGGVFTRLTARAVGVGLRLVVLPIVAEQLMGIARGAIEQAPAPPHKKHAHAHNGGASARSK